MYQSALKTLCDRCGTTRTHAVLVLALSLLVAVIGFAPAGAQGNPECEGEPATIIGTRGDDTLRGTPGPDVIVGLDGDDMIFGLQGGDMICGNRGVDAVRGGTGSDDVNGGSEDDLLVAGDVGDDRLLGGEGWDTLEGGDGDDVVAGGEGTGDVAIYANASRPVTADLTSDTASGQGSDSIPGIEGVEGSAFSDVLLGDGAFNNLFGLDGDDQITGGAGGGNLSGGAGADIINGGPDGDSLFGDEGDDSLFGNGSGEQSDDFFGGLGDDEQWGSDGQDVFWSSSSECCGEPQSAGADSIHAFGDPERPDVIRVDDGVGDDFVDCGADGGSATADVGDTLTNCEG